MLEMAYDYANDMTCFSNIVGAIIETSTEEKSIKLNCCRYFGIYFQIMLQWEKEQKKEKYKHK